jgi:hypothetical protein
MLGSSDSTSGPKDAISVQLIVRLAAAGESDAMWDLATLEAPTNFRPCTALGNLNAATL